MITFTEVSVWAITTNIYLNLLARVKEQSSPKWIDNKPST